MGLFSFSRKNKQEPAAGDSGFYSRPDEEAAPVRSRGRRKDNQANEADDPVLPEKKRARRRLVGAIALVLAAVVGLPMVFDSEPKPVADDITIQIPSKDKAANVIHDNGLSASLSKVAASDSLDAREEISGLPNQTAGVAKLAATEAVATVAEAKQKTDGDKQAKTENTANTNKPAGKSQGMDAQSEAKRASQTDSKPESKNKDQSGKIAVKASESKTSTDKNSGKIVLQVAALMTQEKINELQGKLKKAGFKTMTQKVATESGVSTRIRVGPYATKEEADKARAKLIKIGLNGTPVSR
jgi:DedD protein